MARFSDGANSGSHAASARTVQVIDLRRKFDQFDKNGDRSLDFGELAELLRKGNPSLTTKELRLLFSKVDKDGDNVVNFDEFVTYVFSTRENSCNQTMRMPQTAAIAAQEERPGSAPSLDPVAAGMRGSCSAPSLGGKNLRSTMPHPPGVSGSTMRGRSNSSSISTQAQMRQTTAFSRHPQPAPADADSTKTLRLGHDVPAEFGSTLRPPRQAFAELGGTLSPQNTDLGNMRTLGPADLGSSVRSMHPAPPELDKTVLSFGQDSELASTIRSMDTRHADLDSSWRSFGSTVSMLDSTAQSIGSPASSASPTSLGARSVALPRLGSKVRIIFIRHGHSANKSRSHNTAATPDPELSNLGYEQAEALGLELGQTFCRAKEGDVIVLSSPMRRCLLTIRPTVQRLPLAPGDCLCHASFFEFACAGTSFAGTSESSIAADFPEFTTVGFNADGHWDYRGSSRRETEEEVHSRAERMVHFIGEAAQALSLRPSHGQGPKTMLICIHQTMADLICRLLVEGSSEDWSYGEIKYKLQNTAMTEVILGADSCAKFGTRNRAPHLHGLRSGASPGSREKGPTKATARHVAECRAMFRKLHAGDEVGEGLSISEVSTLLRSGNPALGEAEIAAVFRAVDITGKGRISFNKLIDYLNCPAGVV